MSDIPTIDMRAELLDRHEGAIKGLHRLSTQIQIEKWALVGGLMVLVLAYEYDTHSWRASQTKDADIVVDVVADPGVLSATISTLQAQGFTLDASVGSGNDVSRCTFSSYKAQIDVLCPSDATPDMLDSAEGLRSIAMPGGRRALRSARPVNLFISEDYFDVKLSVPNVAGAIIVKAEAALDERTSDGQRHIDDVAFLLGLPFDLLAVANDLEPGDSDLLRRLAPRLTNSRDPVWDQCPVDHRERAIAAFETLIRGSL